MQSCYPAQFERDMGCTLADWLRWIPGAVGARPVQLASQSARIEIGAGALELAWHELPPRRIGLVILPRLHVSFAFPGVDEAERQAFMRHFDLYTQRGGG
jgi:hypothetical protein